LARLIADRAEPARVRHRGDELRRRGAPGHRREHDRVLDAEQGGEVGPVQRRAAEAVHEERRLGIGGAGRGPPDEGSQSLLFRQDS
jgi:hypothetical protein